MNPLNIYLLHVPIQRVCGWTSFGVKKTKKKDLEELSSTNILFGIWQRKEGILLINHLIILAKQHIYECRMKRVHPSYRIFTNKVEYVYRLESQMGKLNNKESSHKRKWKKYTD